MSDEGIAPASTGTTLYTLPVERGNELGRLLVTQEATYACACGVGDIVFAAADRYLLHLLIFAVLVTERQCTIRSNISLHTLYYL